LELAAPPASTSIVATSVVGASSAATDGVLDDIAVVEAVVAIGTVGTPSDIAAPLGVGAAVAGSIAGAWGPGGTVSAVAARGEGGTALGVEEEEALINKGWVKAHRHGKKTNQKERGFTHLALDLPTTLEAG
jgi:hypothetical protein